jgi:hypothetical protein
MKHSTGKPTKAEQKRFEDIKRLGCVACASLNVWSPAHEIHHLLRGNKRLGHVWSIPLCRGHHRGDWDPAQRAIFSPNERIAISDGRKAFERVYPSEMDLWRKVQKRLHLPAVLPPTKILPRREVA